MLEWWRTRRDGGPPHPAAHRRALEPFIKDTFGLPSSPGDRQQLQGYVAELVWHRLTSEHANPDGQRTLYHIGDLSWSVYRPPLGGQPRFGQTAAR